MKKTDNIVIPVLCESPQLPGHVVPLSYSPPLEQICTSCGGKHVGSCPLNACRSN